MEEKQALTLATGMDLLKRDQQPDVVVVLLLAKPEGEPESAKRRCTREEPRKLALHSTVLRQGSPFFAALLRWDAERDSKGQEPLPEVVVEGCQDLDASAIALQLLYCKVLNKTPLGQIVLHGVEHALSVLKACTYFLFEFGIEHCRSFLGAAKWEPDDRKKISMCFGELGLELGQELTERLDVQKRKTGSREIVNRMFAAALSLEGPTFTQSNNDPGYCRLLDTERPRHVLQEQATSGWVGLDSGTVQQIAGDRIQQRPWFERILHQLQFLWVPPGEANNKLLIELVSPKENLRLFVREMSCLAWLTSFCLEHKLALGALKILWTSEDAENFARSVPEMIFKLYVNKGTKPLLDLFAELLFKPLEKLFNCATEVTSLFDEQSRTKLLQLWMPIVLSFEQEDLLNFHFIPYWIEAIFNSLPQEARNGFLKKWSGEIINLSQDNSQTGTSVGNFVRKQLECYVLHLELDPIDSISQQIEALKESFDDDVRNHIARSLVLQAAKLIKREPKRAQELARLWSSTDLNQKYYRGSAQESLLLQPSAVILAAVADVNNLVPKNIRFAFLTKVLPMLLEADKTGNVLELTAAHFETVLSTLSFGEQEQLALTWVKGLVQKDSDGAYDRGGLVLDEVFDRWCKSCRA